MTKSLLEVLWYKQRDILVKNIYIREYNQSNGMHEYLIDFGDLCLEQENKLEIMVSSIKDHPQ